MAMFVLILTILPACGCSQRHVLRMSDPELSTTVTFFDQGPADSDDDDTTIVLDEPKRIIKVAAFFQARTEKWVRIDEETRRKPRAAITFRKGDQTTERYWLGRDRLSFQSPEGIYYVCSLSDAERAELKNYFHFTTNFKSDG
jgi:hypothetical protein